MNIEQIRAKAADCRKTIRHAEFVAPGIKAQTVVIIGIGAKHVRVMLQDGTTKLFAPGFPMFVTCVW